MVARVPHRLIGAFAFFAWLHLALYVYPLPPQAAAQFQVTLPHDSGAEPSVDRANDAKLQKDGVPNRDLEVEFWFNWITNILLLGIGVFVSILAYRNYRHWKIALLLPSLYICYVTLFPVGADIVERGGLVPWLELWSNVSRSLIEKGDTKWLPSSIYNFFVWPSYHVAIVLMVFYCLYRSRYGGDTREKSV